MKNKNRFNQVSPAEHVSGSSLCGMSTGKNSSSFFIIKNTLRWLTAPFGLRTAPSEWQPPLCPMPTPTPRHAEENGCQRQLDETRIVACVAQLTGNDAKAILVIPAKTGFDPYNTKPNVITIIHPMECIAKNVLSHPGWTSTCSHIWSKVKIKMPMSIASHTPSLFYSDSNIMFRSRAKGTL